MSNEHIGRTETRTDRVRPGLLQRLAATLGVPVPDALPPLWHWALFQDWALPEGLGPDGHPRRGGFLPDPAGLPRRMWAGGRLSFLQPLRVGDALTRTSRIASIANKQARSGPLVFVTVEHEIATAAGVALREEHDIVYRDMPAPGATVIPAAAPTDETFARKVVPDDVLLFRYSALTFNGHRIHYDAPYARGVEGYPGLIVHGPLQASLLVRMAEALRGARPARFGFRSLSPLFDDRDFTLNATDAGDGSMRLWTACADGPIAMEASAVW